MQLNGTALGRSYPEFSRGNSPYCVAAPARTSKVARDVPPIEAALLKGSSVAGDGDEGEVVGHRRVYALRNTEASAARQMGSKGVEYLKAPFMGRIRSG